MSNITDKARRVILSLAEGSSINAVSKLVGIPQQTLSRFVSNPEASLSLKNFEKIQPYMRDADR